ncbi:MAG: WD40 repeat domain-containing protein, partial [Planctomycetota bacterium]
KLVTAEGGYGRVHVWDVHTARQTQDWDLRRLGGGKRSFAVGGAVVAVGLGRSGVELWSADSGRKLGSIGYDLISAVRSLAVSPDGKLLAVGGPGGEGMSVWDVESRRKSHEIDLSREWGSAVGTVRFSQDGKILAFRYFGHVAVCEAATGKLLMASKVNDGYKRVHGVALATDSTIVASLDTNAGIGLWSIATGKRLRQIQGHEGFINSLDFSVDGGHLASGGGGSSSDGTVRVWDVATGAEVARLKGHGGQVTSVAFSPDGKLLASGSTDTTALVWDWEEIQKAHGVSRRTDRRRAESDRAAGDD